MARRKRVRLDAKGRPVQPAREAPSVGVAEEAVDAPPRSDCRCPWLDPADWHDVESDWSDIQFIRVHSKALFGVPVGFDGVRKKLHAVAEQAGATIPDEAMMLLGPGRFFRPLMLEVESADVARKNVVTPGGVAYSRLASAPWGEMRKHATDTIEAATERFGRSPDELWVWYLTCTQCSGERGYETLFVAHYKDDPVDRA